MKKLYILFLIMILILSFTACGGSEAPSSETDESGIESVELPEFSIIIEGAEATAFTNADASDFELVEIEAVQTKKDGSEETNLWTGIVLKDVLAFAGVSEYSSLTIEASDGYAQEYTPNIVEGETILAFYKDGELIDDTGSVQLVPKGEPGNMWIRKLSKITINQ